jgi:hypothetical protein
MTNNSPSIVRRSPWLAALLGLTLPVLLVGCGNSNLTPVSGKVTYMGQPVKGGMLIFSPMAAPEEQNPGKAAAAEVSKDDGSYSLGTYQPGDGAQLGKHRVTYSPPEQVLTEQQRKDPRYIAPPAPYTYLTPKTGQVEVKAGENTLDIELVPMQ